MYNNQITCFKYVSLISLMLVLGGCAATGYGPVVEDLSVPARASERLPTLPSQVPASIQVTPAPSAPVVTAKPKAYVAPKSVVTITAQPVSNQVVTVIAVPENASVATQAAPSAAQKPPLPASDQAVVEQLLTEADQLKAQGKVTEAVIQLQRAQRIAPREPKVYARLAALQLSLGEASRAEQLALKGLTLVPNKKSYQYYFWKLIGASRSNLGDSQGEAKAIAQAAKYK
ncbi:hypothetical protein ABXT60_01640 [Candidatus Njordibacter sp. Uisw_056]|jgi:hypothetical protein|uniref:hypothetical protein n=1 Tax=Candidatus Njordibacter sp. Uisw_056 TaxID=3230973 RepID=UPI003D3EC21F